MKLEVAKIIDAEQNKLVGKQKINDGMINTGYR